MEALDSRLSLRDKIQARNIRLHEDTFENLSAFQTTFEMTTANDAVKRLLHIFHASTSFKILNRTDTNVDASESENGVSGVSVLTTLVRCAECQKLLSEVSDLKILINNCFGVLAQRLDDQNRQLSTVVKAVSCNFTPEDDDFRVAANSGKSPSHQSDCSETSQEFRQKNQRLADEAAIDVDDESRDDVDVKPDLTALKRSLTGNPGNGESSATAQLVDVRPLEFCQNSADGEISSPGALLSAPLGTEPKKQFILVRNNADGNLNVISGAVSRRTYGTPPYFEIQRKKSDVFKVLSDAVAKPVVSSTPLGAVVRKPISEEAKRRLAVSRPKMFPCSSLTKVSSTHWGTPIIALSAFRQKQTFSSTVRQSGVGARDVVAHAKRRLTDSVEKMKQKKKRNPSADSNSNSKLNAESVASTSAKEKVCPVCSKEFCSDRSLRRHVITHVPRSRDSETSSLTVEDTVLSAKAHSDEEILAKHAKPHPTWARCQYCHEVIKDRSKLLDHENEHSVNNDRFACALCPQAYNRVYNLHRHVKQMHGGVVPAKTTTEML